MAINWLDTKTYTDGFTPPKKITEYDIALGTGLLNYELGITQELFIQYLIDLNFITKSQEASYKNAFMIHTKGDALRSTLGPVFEKMKTSGTAFPKDVAVMDSLLNTRNEYVHNFVHKTRVNENIDLHASARSIIKSINDARKLNNRYRGVHQKYVKDIKKVEENKKAAKKKQTVKSIVIDITF